MGKILRYAFIDSIATALYVILVGSFLYVLSTNTITMAKSVIIPIAMLMLLVFSVAIVGSFLFGRPAVWYVDGKKKEAVILLAYTLGIFLIITLAVFLLLIGFY
jgi:hypothetical protein